MVNLNKYIIEKLHINKDINISNSHKEVINKLNLMCNTDMMSKEKEEKTKNIINKWVEDNDVTDIIGYTDWLDLKHIGIADERIKMFAGDSRDTTKYVDDVIGGKHTLVTLSLFMDIMYNDKILVLINNDKRNIYRVFVKK